MTDREFQKLSKILNLSWQNQLDLESWAMEHQEPLEVMIKELLMREVSR